MESILTVRVWRGTERGAFASYEVPRNASQTVLDVVTHIQRRLEPALAYRFACRVGMCGSCAMTVNGVPRWTCRTHVASVAKSGALEIAPLAHLPVIRDLVTDMRGFFDKRTRAGGQFAGDRTRDDDSRACHRTRPSGRPPTPASNASGAEFATPPATSLAGAPTISGRLHSIGRGHSRMTRVTFRNRRGCARSPATPAVTPATRRAPARSVVRSTSRRPPGSPA